MAAQKRVYVVTNITSNEPRLVNATNAVQARNHVAKDLLTVSVASQQQLITLLTGANAPQVEDASAADNPPEGGGNG